MKRNLLSLGLLAGLLSTGLALAHGDEAPGISAGITGRAGAAHQHSHRHGDTDGIGQAVQAAQATRTVEVEMTDAMRFNPSNVKVKQGETIRFMVKNAGQLKHEFVLGSETELKEHAKLMKKFPEMEHNDPNMVTVAAGKTGEVIWQFSKAGTVNFACLQPGHYDAGMKGTVSVVVNDMGKAKVVGSHGH